MVDVEQYGGEKECGAEHLLIELWDRILEALDEGKDVACLLEVDFEKAFNRMDHATCLTQLEELGASPGSLRLVGSFLEGRTMTIKLGGQTCGERKITRGSPQGSVLGCALYCATTQNLTKNLDVAGAGPPGAQIPMLGHLLEPDEVWTSGLPDMGGGRVRFFPGSSSDESEGDINFWDNEDKVPEIWSQGSASLGEESGEAFKYIDDTTVFEAVSLATSIKHFTTKRTIETIIPLGLQSGLVDLAKRAEAIGMKVNVLKTQLLCISPNNGCDTVAMITPGDTEEVVRSSEEMKLVGFTFGTTPGVSAHVQTIGAMFRRKVWMLFHLNEAGIRGYNLYKLYCCFIRSCIYQ